MGPIVLGILALFLALAVLFLAVPLKARVRARVTLESVDVKVSIKPPILPWFVPLPMPGLKGRRTSRAPGTRQSPEAREAPETREAPKTRKHKEIGLVDRVRSFVLAVRALVPSLREALVRSAEAVLVERIRVVGKVGTGDAFQTALIVAGLNSLFGVTLTISRRKGVRFRQRPQVRFGPAYHGAHLDVGADVIVAASLWDLLKLGWSFRTILKPARHQIHEERWNTKRRGRCL